MADQFPNPPTPQNQTQVQTFVVDTVKDFFVVSAYTVYNVDGDLIFTGQDGTVLDMVAAGHWTRCKVAKL